MSWQLHAPKVRKADVEAALEEARDRTIEGAETPDAETGEPGPGLPEGTVELMDVAITAAAAAARELPGKRAVEVTIEGRAIEDELRLVVTVYRPGDES